MSFNFDELPAEDGAVIQQHSRSFSLAAKLLPAAIRPDVEKLYAWCRWCDDAVDDAPNVESAKGRLELLRADVRLIYEGRSPAHPASKWLARLVDEYEIPIELPLDLLDGMETDLASPVLHSVDELLLYCYRAAGTVGLMMCRIMGVTDAQALPKAKALGMAMQLTNIARDIGEDWQRGRRYVPQAWIAFAPAKDTTPSNHQVRSAVKRLLDLADSYYAEGLSGLAFLPRGARYAIRLAGKVYQEIGDEIRRQNYQVMNQRVFVPARQKLKVAAKCLFGELKSRVQRSAGQMIGEAARSKTFTNSFSQGDFEMKNETLYLFYLGLSLTFVMATTLFALIGINPKETSYEALPWIYAAGCAALATVTGFLARRCDRLSHLETAKENSQ